MSCPTVGIVMPLGRMGGGAERALLDLATSEAGHSFRYAFLEDGDLVAAVAESGRPVLVQPVGRIRSIHRAVAGGRSIGNWFRHEGVTAVLVWMAAAIVPGTVAAKTAGAKLAWYQHCIPEKPSPLDRLATLAPASRILACSERARRYQELLRPHREVTVVHPPVGLTRIQSELPSSRAIARQALDLPHDRFIALMMCRMERWKRPDLLIQAVSHLEPDVMACIVGSPHPLDPLFAEEVRHLPAALGVGDRVRLPGWRKDIPTWLAAADVLVSASSGEPFGISMVEGLAAGLPVIGTYGGGAEEIVRQGIDGYLVQTGDVEALVEAIRAVQAASPWNQSDLRARAEVFSSDRAASRLLAAIQP